MPSLPAWATQKVGPLPVWGWGAAALGGGVGWVLWRRRSAGSSSSSPLYGSAARSAGQSSGDATGDVGSFGGGAGFGLPGGSSPGESIGVSPGIGSGSGSTLGSTLGLGSGSGSTPALGSSRVPAGGYYGTPEDPIYRAQPAVQLAPSFLGGGYQAGQNVLWNPAGAADALAAISGGTYTPSLTDYASEQGGGIQTVQAGLPGTQPNQGLTYSVYGTNTGTGPVVPSSQRIAGERYDQNGRVIL